MSTQELNGQDNKPNTNQGGSEQQQKTTYKLPQINNETTLADLIKIKDEYNKFLIESGYGFHNISKEGLTNLQSLEDAITEKNKENVQYSEALRKTNIEISDDIHRAIESPLPPTEGATQFNNFIAANKKLISIREREIEKQRREILEIKAKLTKNEPITPNLSYNSYNKPNEKKRPIDENSDAYHSIFDQHPNKKTKQNNQSKPNNSENKVNEDDEMMKLSKPDQKLENVRSCDSFLALFIPRNNNTISKNEFTSFIKPIKEGNVSSPKNYELKLDVK